MLPCIAHEAILWREQDSEHAAKVLASCRPPTLLCAWQLLEIRNAMRLKVFRREVSPEQYAEADGYLRTDVEAGILAAAPIDLDTTLARAARLSEAWTMRLGCRTLDIIHVSAALLLKADQLITFDRRQGDLAKKAGLKVHGV